MPILAADDLFLAYGKKTIFEGASVAIEPRDRMGIVGLNGTGKSTLLKILAGQLAPDGGRVNKAKGIRVGYLAQEHGDPGEGTLLDSVLKEAPGKDALEAKIAEIEEALAQSDDTEEQLVLADELAESHHQLAALAHEFAPHRAQRILVGLGFSDADFNRPVRALSGGWRMRAALAALLFGQPDVLLLDEPTNHLDVPSVHWLSSFLDATRHALVLTCHDKEFLNRHVTRVASLELEGLRLFRGNYDQYLVQRELDLEYLENRAKKDEQRRKELEAFVERFRAKATKARQAQSKAKQLEKMQESMVELPELRRAIAIKFAPVERSGEVVVKTTGLGHGYGERPLFSGIDLSLKRGQRVAIVGVNGAGKTTLLKLIAQELTPRQGTVEYGRNVTLSYFAQHHTEALALHHTVLEEVWQANPDLSQSAARGLCGAFLFSGDDVEKTISVLSGGEKARVALAKLLAKPGNLLLLDEPTNHLDTESADKLTESLLGYDGTLIFVSHNLDFARRLSDTVWDVKNGTVTTYPGSLADYLTKLSEDEADADARYGGTADPTRLAAGPSADKAARIEAREAAQKAQSDHKKRKKAAEKRAQELEAEIQRLESEQSTLEAALADPATHQDHQASREKGARYEVVKKRLHDAMEEWATAEQERESLG